MGGSVCEVCADSGKPKVSTYSGGKTSGQYDEKGQKLPGTCLCFAHLLELKQFRADLVMAINAGEKKAVSIDYLKNKQPRTLQRYMSALLIEQGWMDGASYTKARGHQTAAHIRDMADPDRHS